VVSNQENPRGCWVFYQPTLPITTPAARNACGGQRLRRILYTIVHIRPSGRCPYFIFFFYNFFILLFLLYLLLISNPTLLLLGLRRSAAHSYSIDFRAISHAGPPAGNKVLSHMRLNITTNSYYIKSFRFPFPFLPLNCYQRCCASGFMSPFRYAVL